MRQARARTSDGSAIMSWARASASAAPGCDPPPRPGRQDGWLRARAPIASPTDNAASSPPVAASQGVTAFLRAGHRGSEHERVQGPGRRGPSLQPPAPASAACSRGAPPCPRRSCAPFGDHRPGPGGPDAPPGPQPRDGSKPPAAPRSARPAEPTSGGPPVHPSPAAPEVWASDAWLSRWGASGIAPGSL